MNFLIFLFNFFTHEYIKTHFKVSSELQFFNDFADTHIYMLGELYVIIFLIIKLIKPTCLISRLCLQGSVEYAEHNGEQLEMGHYHPEINSYADLPEPVD